MDNIHVKLPLNEEQIKTDPFRYMTNLVRELENLLTKLSFRDYEGERLLSQTTVSFAADGDTDLYRVPPESRCVITKAIVVAAADCGTTTISIGQEGAETDAITLRTLSAVDAQYDAAILALQATEAPVLTKSYAPGTTIQAKVGSHAGAAGNIVLLYGVLY